MSKQRITTARKQASREDKLRRLDNRFSEWVGNEVSIEHAYNHFKIEQQTKGNSKPTIAFYDRFYKKFVAFLTETFKNEPKKLPVNMLTDFVMLQQLFVESMGDVNIQTINAYLRGYRAFGKFCEEQGYIDGFKCPIKEVEPPVKQVYTEKELQRLLTKPDITYFEGFRNYTIICLLLATGVRTNTILNLRIEDVNLDEGKIAFNTTKAHKVVIVPLEKKALIALREYIGYWRTGGDTEPTDYLFCNIYGEQLSRSGLSKAIATYNKEHNVEKTSIHLFRHTFAKDWITSGGDIISLARVLTHSELDMVKRYANLYDFDVKNEIEQHSSLAKLRTHSGQTIGTKKKQEIEEKSKE